MRRSWVALAVSAIGCSSDWQPDCAHAQLTRRADDDVWSATVTVPARMVAVFEQH